ncbi:MAG: type IV pilus biogenesis/stability protein PilW [Gammaproteobacteria bacterium]|nr:MAG: type IV pilus biogenesis/stability protein PilW [Gammaproteobacteria bacterium]
MSPISCFSFSGFGRVVLAVAALHLAACASTGGEAGQKRRDAAQFNAQLGAQYLQRGELDQARSKLVKALAQDERNALAHVSYAKLLQRIDKPAKAQQHFARAIDLEPDQAEHHNSYGIFLCQQGHEAEALQQFKKAADNPYYKTPEFALDNGGLCLIEAERHEEASLWLREAIRRNPQFGPGYLHMAEVFYVEKRLTLADAYLQRFNHYENETAASLLLELRIKRDSGDLGTAQKLASKLLNRFPSSPEAAEFLSR